MPLENSDIFINDLNLVNYLNVSLFRADIIKGEITEKGLPENLPDNSYIFSHEDLEKNEINVMGNSVPLLCDNHVSFQNQPVFIVAAESEKDVNHILDSINTEYHPSTPLFFDGEYTPEQILKERKSTWTYIDEEFPEDMLYTVETETDGLAYKLEYNDQLGVVINVFGNMIKVFAATQWPDHVRDTVADIMGVDKTNVVVKVMDIPSPLEGRLWFPSYHAAIAAVVAKKTGRSVKFFLSREEALSCVPAQYPFRIKYRTTVLKETDRIVECDVNIDINAGAYPVFSQEVMDNSLKIILGGYKCSKINITQRLIKTSMPPMSFITGPNFMQLFIATENHINAIISERELGPDEWRCENVDEEHSHIVSNIVANVARSSDFRRKYYSYELAKKNREAGIEDRSYHRGIGLAIAYFKNDADFNKKLCIDFTGHMQLNDNWQVTFSTGTVPQQFLSYELWESIIKKETGLDEVFIGPHHTDLNRDSAPDLLGGMTTGVTELVKKCCKTLQEKRINEPLPFEFSKSINPNELMNTIAWGAAAVEISMDMSTYTPKIESVWTCFDCGAKNNEDLMKKSLYKQVVNSIAWTTKNREDFYVPISVSLINSRKTDDIHSCGDLPFAIIPAAYSSAVSQAIGKMVSSFPVSPEYIYRKMENS